MSGHRPLSALLGLNTICCYLIILFISVGPFLSNISLMSSLHLLHFILMFAPSLISQSKSYRLIMAPNLSTQSSPPSWLNTALSLGSPTHTHHLKMGKLSACIAQQTMQYEHHLFMHSCRPPIGMKPYPPPHSLSTGFPPQKCPTPLLSSSSTINHPPTMIFMSLVASAIPTSPPPLHTNCPHGLYHVSSSVIQPPTKATAVSIW
jgi:hypothetical protein